MYNLQDLVEKLHRNDLFDVYFKSFFTEILTVCFTASYIYSHALQLNCNVAMNTYCILITYRLNIRCATKLIFDFWIQLLCLS